MTLYSTISRAADVSSSPVNPLLVMWDSSEMLFAVSSRIGSNLRRYFKRDIARFVPTRCSSNALCRSVGPKIRPSLQCAALDLVEPLTHDSRSERPSVIAEVTRGLKSSITCISVLIQPTCFEFPRSMSGPAIAPRQRLFARDSRFRQEALLRCDKNLGTDRSRVREAAVAVPLFLRPRRQP